MGKQQRLIGVAVCILAAAQANAQEAAPLITDHHLHVLSPRLIADWKAVGARFSRDDESYTNPVKFCETHKIAKGFLVSMAHLYTTEDFGATGDPKKEQQLVQAENDFVVLCVKTAPERFVGFFSVNPLRAWAFEEMERCRKQPGLRGLKLHLPACGVDLLNEQHRAALGKTFAWAVKNDVAVLIHISGFERPFGAEESRIFWQELVRAHPGLHVYLAHLGASGGYNDRSKALFEGYQKLVSTAPKFARNRVFFDLSGAILAEAVEGIEPTSPERCKELAEKILEIGVEHFVFASDYPVFLPTDYMAALRERVPLPREQMDKLLKNQSPLFRKKSIAK